MNTIRILFGKKITAHYNSSNLVDKDVQSMLLFLNLMQHIKFCPKYRIKNNFITQNSLFSNFISMFGTLIFMILFILSTYLVGLNKESLGYTTVMYVTTCYSCVFYSFGFAMNFVVGIIETDNSIQFVLTFQEVHRFLNDETNVKRFIACNWILGIAMGSHVIVCTYIHIQLGIPFYAIYSCYLMLVFDINIFYATQTLKLLENKARLWNIQVFNCQVLENTENNINQFFQAYIDILRCYEIYKVGFQQFILFHIIEVFAQSLGYIQIAIETFKKDGMKNNVDVTTLLSFYVLFCIVKDLMWQTILIKQCEKFYSAIQSVQDTCALILKSTCSDDKKRLCKNVLRLHRASFSKIRVCGLFYLDAALQLSLISLLTNYTVVLLQFAYL